MGSLFVVSMPPQLMRNLNCWASWQMSLLLLLKAFPLCLREPQVLGKMRRGLLSFGMTTKVRNLHLDLAPCSGRTQILSDVV
nr:exocyst complex component 5-like [Ipomoea batatas]